MDINRIDRLYSFSPGISQFIGFIAIAISMVMVFLIPPGWFSFLITVSIAFAILSVLLTQRKLRLFIAAAFIEHIIIVIVLSAIVYTKPPIRKDPDKATVTLEIFPQPKREIKRIQSVPQVTIPDIKMPPLKTKSAVTKYLSSSENDVISSIPVRSRSYRLSPGGLATSDRNKITGQATGKTFDSELMVKDTRISQQSGEYKPSSRFNRPSEGGKPSSHGRFGPMTSGRIATGSSLESSSRVQRGSGLFQITGEVKGRRVTYWPEVPEVRGHEVGVVVLTFWVNPEGKVLNVLIKRKAADPLLEKKAKQFVEQIRFARLPKGVEQKSQIGEITIDFTKDLKRKT